MGHVRTLTGPANITLSCPLGWVRPQVLPLVMSTVADRPHLWKGMKTWTQYLTERLRLMTWDHHAPRVEKEPRKRGLSYLGLHSIHTPLWVAPTGQARSRGDPSTSARGHLIVPFRPARPPDHAPHTFLPGRRRHPSAPTAGTCGAPRPPQGLRKRVSGVCSRAVVGRTGGIGRKRLHCWSQSRGSVKVSIDPSWVFLQSVSMAWTRHCW